MNKRKPIAEQRRFLCEIRVECQDNKERWTSSIPLTWTDARRAADGYERTGLKARVRELEGVELVRVELGRGWHVELVR